MLRRIALVVGVGFALALTACVPVVPTAPNNQPLSMTVRDGQLLFQWCGATSPTFEYLLVRYSVYEDPRQEGISMAGAGEFSLEPQMEFSADTPPGAVVISEGQSVPLTESLTRVFVYASLSREDLMTGVNAIFETSSLAGLGEDRWLHPSGQVSDRACE